MVEQKGNCNLAVKLSLLCLLLSWISAPLAAETTVVINKSYSESDPRYQYVYELLQKVLDVSESKYGRARLKQSSVLMSRDRVFASLLNGEELDIMAEALKPQWDRELLMVPVPIRKGVQGYRIFLIHKDHTDVMDGVTSLQDLKALSTGSGYQWSTRFALTSAGFNVVAGSSYDGLFGMLMAKRFVTFGRGINEAYREREFHLSEYPDIVVDENILLSIPLPTFFFVTPQRPILAERIEWGMRHLMDSGEFDRFFYEYHCADLMQAKLHQRQHFEISNPLFSQKQISHYRSFFLEVDETLEDVCRNHISH